MSVYVDQMFNTTTSSMALTGLNGGTTAAVAPYNVPVNGRLIKVTVLLSGAAASSLIEGVRVELTCTNWNPNTMRVGSVGGALRTAPAFPIPSWDWPLDQPVTSAVAISGAYLFTITAVTPVLVVFGTFSTNMMPQVPIPGF